MKFRLLVAASVLGLSTVLAGVPVAEAGGRDYHSARGYERGYRSVGYGSYRSVRSYGYGRPYYGYRYARPYYARPYYDPYLYVPAPVYVPYRPYYAPRVSVRLGWGW